MIKKEKFDVTVAAFEALLTDQNLWNAYYVNFKETNGKDKSTETYTEWKKWAYATPPSKWVSCAFIWDETPQRHWTWREFEYRWLKRVCEYLKF